mmetsp:Transcript_62819/g.130320  ORF Transcript_62819/g.130320 Transcript_62819/m.130320 type:complete len:308 (-) Transcript_62819:407-1330(-)
MLWLLVRAQAFSVARSSSLFDTLDFSTPCLPRTTRSRRPKCARLRQTGRGPLSESRKSTWREATMLWLLVRPLVSFTATATRTCSSSQPRPKTASSARWHPKLCRTSSAAMQWKMEFRKMEVSLSTVVKAGQRLSSTTTRSTLKAASPLQWEIIISPAQRMAARPRLSTHLAIRRIPMERCESSCTIPQCRSRTALPHLPLRRRMCKLCRLPGPMPSSLSPRLTLREAITWQLRPRQQASSTAMATRMCSSSPPKRLMRSSVQKLRMPCHTLSGTRRLRTVTPRMPVSPSTAARAGRTWFSKTTRST